jgi:molybdenum cofactor biosynthesis enzyme MoaA
MNTCLMCTSLYVKANGELPCWDDVGENELVFRTLDVNALADGRERNIFYSPELRYIRQSFLQGQDPFPEVCSRCAVRGHGSLNKGIDPASMDILHLEASYLCHLSCPQCIPASFRRFIKEQPYHLTVRMLRGLLDQLRSEGVRHIKMVHFEGRGDPLMNPGLPELIAATKAAFPDCATMVTTHASYPYKPGLVASGLDLLRASIDGAFPENYEKYRVGGNLAASLAFLSGIRNEKQRVRSSLRVEWKYILFEWNDSDEEIALASRLAANLDARLCFVLTHSPGRSTRFADRLSLARKLIDLAPNAFVETTFPLKAMGIQSEDINVIVDEHIEELLSEALAAIRRLDEQSAIVKMREAIEWELGARVIRTHSNCTDLLQTLLPDLLRKAQFPSTLSLLASILHELREPDLTKKVLSRYYWLAAKKSLFSERDARAAVSFTFRSLRTAAAVRTRLRHLGFAV